jgi:RimJ/RimL family protein N-acetyltransferase
MFTYKNLRLYKIGREHLPRLLSLKQESWFGTHHLSILNLDDQHRWFDSLDKDPHSPKNLALIAHEDYCNDNIGVYKIVVDWVNRTAEVGWDVFSEYRGQGLGKNLVAAGSAFCFKFFDLRRLGCEILENNVPSIKCATHAGFAKEGVKREAILKEGRPVNSIVFGLLQDDWTLSQQSVKLPPLIRQGDQRCQVSV